MVGRRYKWHTSPSGIGHTITLLVPQTLKVAKRRPVAKASKIGAKDLKSKVVQLFVVNDDENPASAWDKFANHTPESKREMTIFYGRLAWLRHDAA